MDANRFNEWLSVFEKTLVALIAREGDDDQSAGARVHDAALFADAALFVIDKRRPTDPCPQLPADEMSAGRTEVLGMSEPGRVPFP